MSRTAFPQSPSLSKLVGVVSTITATLPSFETGLRGALPRRLEGDRGRLNEVDLVVARRLDRSGVGGDLRLVGRGQAAGVLVDDQAGVGLALRKVVLQRADDLRRLRARGQERLGGVGRLVGELRGQVAAEDGKRRDQPDRQHNPLRAATSDYRCELSQRTSVSATASSYGPRPPEPDAARTSRYQNRICLRADRARLGPCMEGNHG